MRYNLFAVLMVLFSAPSFSALLTFDDIPEVSQNNYGAIGTYKGFEFSSTDTPNQLDWIDTVGGSWDFGAVSGEYTLLNNYGGSGIITSENGSNFSFDGVWAKVWGNAPARNVNIVGFNNGTEAWRSQVTINGTFTFFEGVNGTIDELRFDFGDFFLLDNLVLNESASVEDVSAPATISLFILGLLAVARARRS